MTTTPEITFDTKVSSRGVAPRNVSQSRATLAGSRRWTIIALLGPFIALFLVFFIAPTVYAAYESLFGTKRADTFAPPERIFVGLDNYISVLTDPTFLASVGHVLAFAVGPVLLMICLALVIALLIDDRVPNKTTAFFRLATFAPYAVPGVIAALMWGFLYSGSTSPILRVLDSWGISIDPMSGPLLLWGLGNITTWVYMGYNVLLFLAQLHTIDPALFEAARIDGASRLGIALRIKLPLIRPAVALSVMINLIGTIQLFNEPQTLRIVTPSITSTWTPTMMAFAATTSNNYGVASAIAILIALVAGTGSFIILRLTRGLS